MFVKSLGEKYKSIYNLIRPVPWKKGQKWSIKDLFIDISIRILDQKQDSKDRSSWTSLKTYQALFTHQSLVDAKRIIIEADPGCGKTTLMNQLAYLWCNKKPPMDAFDLFIVLPMKKMRPGMSICEAIKTILLPHVAVTHRDIKSIMDSCDISKILGLDGLDEYSGRNAEDFLSSEIMSCLRGDMFSEVKVILSTRVSCLPELHDCYIERVLLEKFDAARWETFIKKAFRGDKDVCRKVLKTIKDFDILRSLV